MSWKKFIIKLLALSFALITVFVSLIPAFAADKKYDFTNGDGTALGATDAVSLIEEHIGARLSDAERAFLDSYSTLNLKYNSVINANNVECSYAGGYMNVSARPYTYNASNGKTLVWLPVSVKLGENEFPLTKSGESYAVAVESAEARDFEVIYRAEAEISAEDFGEILNLYYYTAKYARDTVDYEAKTKAYEEYLYEKRLYDDKKAEYDSYLAAYEEYEAVLYVYENYDKLMAEYSKDLAAYNDYLVKLDALADDIARYEAYEAKIAQIEKQLSAFELVYVKMKSNRAVYNAVMGGSVDQVLGSVGEIIAELGNNYKVLVETAEEATKQLRGLMTGYKNCKTVEEKYGFYTSNYSAMCESMLNLTWALDRLYYAPGVKTMMKAFGKHEFYVILVAQLALTSNALIDSTVSAGEGASAVTYDASWRMDGRDINTVLDNVHYFTDDNTSAPFEDGYPAKVEKPDIKEVKKPQLPPKRPSSRPVAPAAVANPGKAPSAVSNPQAPAAEYESVFSAYGKLRDDEKANLASGFKNGYITKRQNVTTPKTVELQTIVSKKYDSQTVILTFDVSALATGMQSFVHVIETDENSPVFYDGPIPDGYSNLNGTYVFAGWSVSGSAEKADLSHGFSDNTVLVPFYNRMPTYFDVTWRVGNEEYVEKHVSGSIPSPGFEPVKADEGDFCYVFDSWRREGTNAGITPLYGNVTYEAKFTKKYLLPCGFGGASVTDKGTSLVCDVSEFTNPMFDLSRILPKIAGRKALSLTSDGANGTVPRFTLNFSFTDVVKMNEAGVISLVLTSDFSGTDSASFEIVLYGADNAKITCADIRPELSVGHKFADVSNFVLLSGAEYANFKIDSGALSLKATPSVKYSLKREYYVTVVKNEMCDVRVDKTYGGLGEAVSVNVFPNPGVSIVGIDVTDDSGNPIAVQDGKITLNGSDIVISVRAKYILYNVAFVSAGKVISRQQLTYGTKPSLPPDPSMPTDSKYSYEFLGWSPSVSEVFGEATYVARFKAIPVTEDNSASPNNPMTNIMKYVEIALIAAAAVLVGAVTLTVVLVVRHKRRKRAAGGDKKSDKGENGKKKPEKRLRKTKKDKKKSENKPSAG